MSTMVALALASVAVPSASAKNVHDQEAHYHELWSEKIPPFADRRKVGRWRMPVFSELHAAVLKRTPKADDYAKERLFNIVQTAQHLKTDTGTSGEIAYHTGIVQCAMV